MSVSEDREVTPAVSPAGPTISIADPGPLGLAAFALTTFLLSASNAHWMNANGTGNAWLGYALAYGGLGQLLAGMWEFRRGNVFAATAFASYGGFWIGLALWFELVAPTAKTPGAIFHDEAWILLAFAIFNTYMLLLASQVNLAVFLVFLTLEITEIVLVVGNFTGGTGGISQAGGYIGVITALVAWYTSAAGVSAGIGGKILLPVGKPLIA